MRRHRLLPHTADTRLQITADSLEELFKGAVEGLSEIIKHDVTKRSSNSSIVTQVDISSNDTTALLVDFLNNLLTKDIIEKVVFFDIIELNLKDTRIMASVRGIAADSFDEDIKAVTYHGAQIQQDKDGNYEVELVCDV
jgi:SHS2 domain-containing protein